MWLKKSLAAADEELLGLVNEGYALLQEHEEDYERMIGGAAVVDERAEAARASDACTRWTTRVEELLKGIFPTAREAYLLRRFGRQTHDEGQAFHRLTGEMQRLEQLVGGLDAIRLRELRRYTELPPVARFYVEQIDSFAKVRDVNPNTVSDAVRKGRVELSEDEVQLALEDILNVQFHRVDWAGETNDLYTANVIVNGARIPTAFALKGNGCKASELRIRDCGRNGDQLVRLFESPADLFVVQYVGPVADAVVKDIAGKVEECRARGRRAWFCIIDGQDTARLLKAYGKLVVRAVPRSRRAGTAHRRARR